MPEVSTCKVLTKLASQISEPEEMHSVFREQVLKQNSYLGKYQTKMNRGL